jgi:hypothetical protein
MALEVSGTTYKTTMDELDTWLATQGALVAFSTTIATADVLTLNATPIEVIAAPGAGFGIQVVYATNSVDWNSVAYATNTTLVLSNPTGGLSQMIDSGSITATANLTSVFDLTPGAALGNIVENEGVEASINTGNPTAGDSDITIEGYYRIVTLPY